MTTVHRVFDVRIFQKECRTLAKGGYDVTLIAVHEQDEQVDGIRIVALERPKNRAERMVRTSWQAFRKARRLKADLFHLHDPELLPVGILLTLTGGRVVYDEHEDLPRQVMQKTWIPKWQRAAVALCARIMQRIKVYVGDAIIAATPSIAKQFAGGVVATVQNFPLLEELDRNSAREWSERSLSLCYIGGASRQRGLVEMVRAMALIPELVDCQLTIAGEIAPAKALEECKSEPGWSRVDYRGWLDRSSTIALLGECTVGIVVFHPLPNHVESQPNKLFEYMAAGLAVLASDFPLWRDIIEGARCGVVVDPLSPTEIATAIERLLLHPRETMEMGIRGRAAVVARFNWDTQASQLLELYATIVGSEREVRTVLHS